MKKINLTIVILLMSILHISAQESCINPKSLKKLDASWEKAFVETNLDFFESTLSENFIWVHNHASQTDSKKTLLESVRKVLNNNPGHWKSRTQKDVKVIISGSTGIVNGFTEVELYNGSKQNYNFMRTYIEKDGKCYLIANHTMVIPKKD